MMGQGRRFPESKNSMCQGPEAAPCLMFCENSEEGGVAETEWMRRRVEGGRGAGCAGSCGPLRGIWVHRAVGVKTSHQSDRGV